MYNACQRLVVTPYFHGGYTFRWHDSNLVKVTDTACSYIGVSMTKNWGGEIKTNAKEGAALTLVNSHGKSRTNGILSALE